MATIGTFTTSQNGYSGYVRTLALNAALRFVPNDKSKDASPDFRILTVKGSVDVGAAWIKRNGADDRSYLSVTLDDPSMPAAIYARLIEESDGNFTLIWTRQKTA